MKKSLTQALIIHSSYDCRKFDLKSRHDGFGLMFLLRRVLQDFDLLPVGLICC